MVTIRIRNVEEDDDEYANWGQDGYQDSLTSTYQSVISAPTVPSGPPASVPASMPPQSPELEVTPKSVPEINNQPPVAASSGPPLPDSGLPEGWTMEQWNAYGEMWLSQNQQKLISRDCKINRRVQDLVVLADYEAKTCMVMDKHQFSY